MLPKLACICAKHLSARHHVAIRAQPTTLCCSTLLRSATQQQLSAAQATMRSQQQQLADLSARLSAAEARAAAAEAAAAGLGTAELKIMLSSLQEQLAAQKAELAVARKVKHEADAAARLQGGLLVAKQEAAGAAAALAQLKEQHRSSEELREEVDRWRLLFKVRWYLVSGGSCCRNAPVHCLPGGWGRVQVYCL
jgi:hypothetical protein